jgi:hypothetical protein
MINFLAMPDQPVELTKMHEEFLRRRVLHSPLTSSLGEGKNSREGFVTASIPSLEPNLLLNAGSIYGKKFKDPLFTIPSETNPD